MRAGHSKSEEPAPSPGGGPAGRSGRADNAWAAEQPTGQLRPLQPRGAHAGEAAPEQLAYVLYTSGSTGRPKGVMVSHRALAGYVTWAAETLLAPPLTDLPATTRLSFDACSKQLLGPLLRGGTVRVLPPEVRAEPGALLRALGERPGAGFNGVPALWEAMLEAAESGEAPLPVGLSRLLLGGERLPAALVERTRRALPEVEILDLYGPTEATANATWGRVEEGGPVTLGRPAVGARLHVLDRRLHPMPVGAPGELVVGGPGLARGYGGGGAAGQPGRTAESFVPDPLTGEPGDRLYRTGDRVRQLADGRWAYLGRLDQQVKLRGIRLELGELEALLAGHPAVTEAVVVLGRDAAGSPRLAAYAVPAAEADAGWAEELRRHLANRLPAAGVPAVVAVDELPRLPTGKVDRRRLAERPVAPAGAQPDSPPPRTPVEEAVAQVWQEVLGVERVGVHDDFFALGGHSLAATRVAARLRRRFKADLPLATLFSAPTVAALARALERGPDRAGAQEAAPEAAVDPRLIPRADRSAPLPLSFQQQRLWFLDRLVPASPVYNLPGALELRGELDVAALERSLREILHRQEVLRTTFPEAAGRPVQRVRPPARFRLPVVDLSGLPKVAVAEEVTRALTRREARRPFHLIRGPLARFHLLRRERQEHHLLLVLHHIAADGWSVGVLARELSALYGALTTGQPAALPPLPLQYGDYAAWQRQVLTRQALEDRLAFWRRTLAGAPAALELPADRPRPGVKSFRGARRPFRLPPAPTLAAHQAGREAGVTFFVVLLAAFQVLLHRYSGATDLTVGVPVANRPQPELEELVGFFANTVVLRGDLAGDPPFRRLLGRLQERALAAWTHQDLPFETLVEELEPERDLARTPLFQVAFALQTGAGPRLELPGLTARLQPLDCGGAKFDLSLFLEARDESLSGALEYSTDLFDPTTIERLVRHLGRLLAAAAGTPDRRLSQLSLLSPGERHQLLAEWNGVNSAAAETAPAPTLADLFEARAREIPHATAVVADGETLSYAHLDRRARGLAGRLGRRGAGPGRVTALFVERSTALPVALLGILKTGAAYLPLDPDDPPERLAGMLEAADAVALVTTRPGEAWGSCRAQADPAAAEGGGPAEPLGSTAPPWTASTVVVNGSADSDADPVTPDAGASIAGRWADAPVYVIFTSGSTGRPKGAGVYQRGFLNLLGWYVRRFGLGPGERVLPVTSLSFDLTQKNLFVPWWVGGQLHLSAVPAWDAEGLRRTVARRRVTLLNLTPSAFYPLVETGGEGAWRELACLRWVFLGGEPIAGERLRPWLRSGRCRAGVVNTYGPTECTDVVAFAPLGSDPPATVPLGRPVDGLTLQVLAPGLVPCPLGVVGELAIGGRGVGMGYLGEPARTAERHLPDLYAGQAGARCYRTGDRVRRLPGGELEFLGRVDDQVKIRGFRVEPGEVEALLRRHPGVREAVVVARELDGHRAGDRRLVAYLVPDEERAAPLVELLRLRGAFGPEEASPLAEGSPFELPNGLTVVHLNRSETEFLYRELFQEETYLRGGVELFDGARVFDVGANVGLFALFVARYWREVEIFCFEPLPPIFEVLRLNAALYQLPVRLFPWGLASGEGEARFHYFPHVSILSGRFADAEAEREAVRRFLVQQGLLEEGATLSGEEIEAILAHRLERRSFDCALTTLSRVMREQGVEQVDLLKVDVEKSELEVLRGIAPEDWPRIRQVVAEVHDQDGRLREIEALLDRQGFRVTVEQETPLAGSGLYNLYAVRPDGRRRATERHREPPAAWTWCSEEGLAADLREHLAGRLPGYMVPSHFVLLPALPWTASGKVDRRALPAPGAAGTGRRRRHAPPRTPLEQRLAAIWGELLGVEQVGLEDDFFALGGHSLLAAQVMFRVRDEVGVEAPLASLFESPTLGGLARVVEECRPPAGPAPPTDGGAAGGIRPGRRRRRGVLSREGLEVTAEETGPEPPGGGTP